MPIELAGFLALIALLLIADLGHQIHLRRHPRRDHVAQEYQDRGLPAIAAELGRALKAPLRDAIGVPDLEGFNRRYVPVYGEAAAA